MILLTRTQHAQLFVNGRQSDVDHIPVVKFYNPIGAGVWLATALEEDGDIMFGLADIGYPELGSWSFGELEAIRLPFGMGIERDVLFTGMFQISAWAEAARTAGSIRAAEQILSDRFRSDAALTLNPADTESRRA
jgi:hypothetical protein